MSAIEARKVREYILRPALLESKCSNDASDVPLNILHLQQFRGTLALSIQVITCNRGRVTTVFRRHLATGTMIVGATFFGYGCFGAVDEDAKSLSGLQKLDLSLTFINLDEESEGKIRTDIELRLRQAGIQIGDVEISSTTRRIGTILAPKPERPPKLVVNATGPNTCDASIAIRQAVRLQRDPKIVLSDNETWSASSPAYRLSTSCEHLRADIEDLLSKFLNAWLSVTPRPNDVSRKGEKIQDPH